MEIGAFDRIPELRCTVSILTPTFLITASHCVKEDVDILDPFLTKYAVITGSTKITDIRGDHRTIHPFNRSDVFLHPEYKGV